MAYLLALLLSFGGLTTAQAQWRAETAAVELSVAQVINSPALTPPSEAVGAWTPLPDLWQSETISVPQQRWYHFEFDDAGWSFPSLYTERACTNVEVWINGERVGSGGSMVEPITRTCYAAHVYRFKRSTLKPRGNRLDLRVVGYPQNTVASRQRAGGLATVWLGD